MNTAETTFSVWSLVADASFGVQFIMFILICSSVISWKLIFEYNYKIKKVERELKLFNNDFFGKNKKSIPEIYQSAKAKNIFGIFIIFKKSFAFFYDNSFLINDNAKKDSKESLYKDEQRFLEVFNEAFDFEIEKAEQGFKKDLALLGTISSASPYIGLLGTVYGILIAFWNLGMAQQATIATVAPSIAEALIATGMGLFVAIPALVAYNRLNHRVDILMEEYDKIKKTANIVLKKYIIKGVE